jgi:hypothetical protein
MIKPSSSAAAGEYTAGGRSHFKKSAYRCVVDMPQLMKIPADVYRSGKPVSLLNKQWIYLVGF